MKPTITISEKRLNCQTEYTFTMGGEVLMQLSDLDCEISTHGEGAKCLLACLEAKGIIILENKDLAIAQAAKKEAEEFFILKQNSPVLASEPSEDCEQREF